MTSRFSRPLIGVVAGATLGLTTSIADSVVGRLGPDGLARGDRSTAGQVADLFSFVLDSGWAWAATAVLAGLLTCRSGGRLWTAAVSGSLALIVGTLIFHGWRDDLATPVANFWLVASVTLGPILGAIGGLTRRPGWTGTLAALVVPVGAVLNIRRLPVDPDSPLAVWITVTVVGAALVTVAAVLFRAARFRHRTSVGSGQTSS